MAKTQWQRDIDTTLAETVSRLDRLQDRPAETRPPRGSRLAVTVPDPDTGEYPEQSECPNTYWIVFVDGSFAAEQAGNLSHSLISRQLDTQARTTAHNIWDGLDGYCPLYSLIEVAQHRGQWWFSHIDSTPCESSSESSESESSESESSESESSESSESESSKSESESESESGSDKSSAIVPASWSKPGYTALFIAECPEVRFDDVMVVKGPATNRQLPIDPKFLEVCQAGSVEVCGCVCDLPMMVGAAVKDGSVHLRFAGERPYQTVQVVIRLTGIRKGFAGHRFPDRSRLQFEANERFINSAYPSK